MIDGSGVNRRGLMWGCVANLVHGHKLQESHLLFSFKGKFYSYFFCVCELSLYFPDLYF